jgi:TP901 family phage tail tape measure protein
LADDLISKYIFKAEGINEVKAQAAQLGGYLQTQGQTAGASFSSKFKSTLSASNLGSVAGTMAAGATAVIPIAIAAATTKALTSSISTAANFEQSMANVASVTGGGAAEMEKLAATAREAGAASVFSASEAGDAMYYLASAGMNADQISASLGDTLNLAAAGGMGLADATEIVTSTLSQYNMGAEEAGRVSNVLAAAAAGSNTTIGQMGVGMSYAGPLANSLGISLEDTSAAMMVLANAGIKSQRGGTALRGVLSSLMDVSDKAAGALEGMGLSVEDIDPALHSFDEIMATLKEHGMTTGDAVKIFGREASSAAIKLVEGADDINKFSDSITGTNKSSEMAAIQVETFQGNMRMLSSAVEEAEISVGNTLLPTLTNAVTGFTEGVRWATEFGSTVSSAFTNIAGSVPDIDWQMLIPGEELVGGLSGIDKTIGEAISGGTETRGLVGSFVGDITGAMSDGLKSAAGQVKIGGEWMKDMADVQAARDAGKLTAQEYLQGLKDVTVAGANIEGPTTGLMDSLQEFATTGKLTTDQYKESLSSVSEIYSQVGDAAAEMTGPLTEGFEEGTVSAEDYIAILEDMSTVSEKLGDSADEALEPLTQAFEDGTVSAEEYKDIMDDVANAVTSLGSDFDAIAGPIQEAFSEGEISATQYQEALNKISQVHTELGASMESVAGPMTEMFESGEISADQYLMALDGVLAGSNAFGDEFNRRMADLNATAGVMSAEEYLANFNAIIEGLGVNVEDELKKIDAEGAGEDAGKEYGEAFSEEVAKSYEYSLSNLVAGGKSRGTLSLGELSVGESTYRLEHVYGFSNPWRIYRDDELIKSGEGSDLLQNYLASDPELWKLVDENQLEATRLEAMSSLSEGELANYGYTSETILQAATVLRALDGEGEILDPYEVWDTTQNMADYWAANADIVEAGGDELLLKLYNLEDKLASEGKAGWSKAWSIIMDPESTDQQISGAINALNLTDSETELVAKLRDTFGDIKAAEIFEELFTEEIPISFASMIKAGLTDFNEIFEDVGSQAISAFNNGISAEEATSIASLYAELKETDREKFEEMGGDDMLSWWLGAQELLDARNLAASVGSDTSQLDAELDAYFATYEGHVTVTAEVNAFGGPLAVGPVDEDGNPITLASLLFGTDADRKREIKRDDLWWRNEVMPLMEDHIDQMLAAATSGYADDYEAAKENARRLYQVQDTYADMMTARQNQLITALRQGEIGIMAFNEQWDKLNQKQDESKKKVDELSDKYGNLAKTTAESMDDCCEAMSAFGKAQEASSDMFFGSYIGPTENYAAWLAETGEYDKRISVGFDFPDDIDQQVAEYLASHPAEMDVNLKELDKETSDKWLEGLGLSADLEINPPSDEDIFGIVDTIEDADATIIPGAELNQDDLFNIVTEINTTETAIPVGLNADAFWREYSAIVNAISNWRIYIPVDVDVVANIPALASQIKAEILAGLQS